ncbi:MAG: hypothetical protein IBX63_10145 [Coriobacteriia bacterium]|nr:hypothetical protein [Coriobacteriia bacterium]
MTEPSGILATLAGLEADGLRIPKPAAKSLEALRQAQTLDTAAARARARDDLVAALRAGDESAAHAASDRVAAHCHHAAALNDELAAVRRELAADAVRALRPLAFEYATARYNEAGKSLMDALAACDPLAGPDDVSAMSAEQVKCWGSLSELNADCDRTAARLRDVLALAGGRVNLGRAEALHALLLTGGDVDGVRQVLTWAPPDPSLPNSPRPSALDTLMCSRAGRWGAFYLHAGCDLQCALREPGDYTMAIKRHADDAKAAQAAERAAQAAKRTVVGGHGAP